MVTTQDALNRLSALPEKGKQSQKDRRFFSDVYSALFINQLEEFIRNQDWLAGIIISGIFLDEIGKTLLIWKDNIVDLKELKKIDKLTLDSLFKQLKEKGTINFDQFKELNRLRLIRNDAAHDLAFQINCSLHKQPNTQTENDIRSTISIIQQIFKAC